MKISEIYEEYGITPNLQDHMLRVCGIVEFFQKHWRGKEIIDWNFTKKMALLHDLGNTVKFDLDKHPEFLGEEESNVQHWKKVQGKIVKRYGSDDHEATKQMLLEIGVEDEMIKAILQKSFGSSIETKNSNNWPLKILYYADLRTLPFGIGTLEERINDVKDRMPKYSGRPDFENLVRACRKIEEQLQRNINIHVSEINDNTVTIKKALLGLSL
ncbi:MAG: hypothetical protein M1352_02590 [Patescibacteria group bacterium]|nr:hypothetical protein [Patescibacteria group bacterium]